ncbi:hypothetical protein [Leclercia adecarboxylata]|uniref:hypothetical protein n=1 Tax=Leclercia adecarboxylata TaxID=83655 RepID=UPI00254AFAF0|nr:hypothetical protein [Leclercia adecarboxylata]
MDSDKNQKLKTQSETVGKSLDSLHQEVESKSKRESVKSTNLNFATPASSSQTNFGSSTPDRFLSGGSVNALGNVHSNNASSPPQSKEPDRAYGRHATYQHTSFQSYAQANTDLHNLGKYDNYATNWTTQKTTNFNSDSFKYTANKNRSTTSGEAKSTFTSKDVESLVWLDLSARMTELTKDMNNNKKNMGDTKKRLGNVISKLTLLTTKTDKFDMSLRNAENKLSEKVLDFEKEIVTARNSLLAVIALFASFFTFISISVNIFSRDMSLTTSISVLLVIWCCLISFIFVFMAGISKGGAFFTSFTFFKHAVCMVIMFICAFTLPRIIFYYLPVQWFP